MVHKCCVKACKSIHSAYEDISFFRFPLKNKELLAQWMDVMPANQQISKCSKICSKHFNRSSYQEMSGRRYLKNNAIPSIFKYDIQKNVSSNMTYDMYFFV
ncbi:THAP domain-containing protein 1 [Trachymyrmex cornetzi]|uniref:THAP domain-containing protein 1 n=1 Tax=Trachymyrmex cornetzi TaxID=471704 RepID=A0A151J7D7_9HYME|nr:THAP domain-containing protein 1 [Trachymyrmex cornetzi]